MSEHVTPMGADHPMGSSQSPAEANRAALHRVLPGAFSEAGLDLEALQELLGDPEMSREPGPGQEGFGLSWPGKAAARRLAHTTSTSTLVPDRDESAAWDTTQNIVVEGDNLEAMKALQKSYAGAVKLITIDPPYNTTRDFVYDDDFRMDRQAYDEASGETDETGARLRSTTELGGRRHSAWLSMMYPRLILARSLLAEDGSIWITLDHTENAHCRVLCDEIFGAENLVGEVVWEKTYSPRNDAQGMASVVDRVLVYQKSDAFTLRRLPRTAEMDARYSSPDGDPVPWKSDNPTAGKAGTNQPMVYGIQHPTTGEILYPPVGRCWVMSPQKIFEVMNEWAPYRREVLDDSVLRAKICGVAPRDVKADVPALLLDVPLEEARELAAHRRADGRWPVYYFTKGGEGGIARKQYLDTSAGLVVTNLWEHESAGHTDGAKKALNRLFPEGQPFDTPKPVKLIQRIVQVATDEDSLVLDFFAGSGTAAEAVMAQNAADGGRRQFMLVQLDEQTPSDQFSSIAAVTRERVRRAGRRIVDEAGLTGQDLDTGFRAYHVADSGITPWAGSADDLASQIDRAVHNTNPSRSEDALVTEMMLRLGLPLTEAVESREFSGTTVHCLGAGALFLCLAEGIDRELGQQVADSIVAWRAEAAPFAESQVIFRDSGFTSDSAKLNTAATLVQGGFPTLTTL